MTFKITNGIAPISDMLVFGATVENIYRDPNDGAAYVVFNFSGNRQIKRLDNGFDDINSQLQSGATYIDLKLTV